MTNKESIEARLQPPTGERYRNILVKLKPEQLKNLERIAKTMSEISGSHVSRNMLLRDAIEAYVLDFDHPDISTEQYEQFQGMNM